MFNSLASLLLILLSGIELRLLVNLALSFSFFDIFSSSGSSGFGDFNSSWSGASTLGIYSMLGLEDFREFMNLEFASTMSDEEFSWPILWEYRDILFLAELLRELITRFMFGGVVVNELPRSLHSELLFELLPELIVRFCF